MKLRLSALFLIAPIGIFLLSNIVTNVPGALLNFYLVGIALCLPNIGFSRGWTQWIAILLAIIFIIISFPENDRGLKYAQLMGERISKIKSKSAEQDAAANP